MTEKRQGSNRNPDPVKSLSRQFRKLMEGETMVPPKDKKKGGEETHWLGQKIGGKFILPMRDSAGIIVRRYDVGNRIYQMQVDFLYRLRSVAEWGGANTLAIKGCQEFINECREELKK